MINQSKTDHWSVTKQLACRQCFLTAISRKADTKLKTHRTFSMLLNDNFPARRNTSMNRNSIGNVL